MSAKYCEGARLTRFACQMQCRDGAFVRRGVELMSELVRTVPQGSVLEAYQKTVNSQGLTRLFVGDGTQRCYRRRSCARVRCRTGSADILISCGAEQAGSAKSLILCQGR